MAETSWRDTLFVWFGKLNKTRDDSSSSSSSSSYTWTGSWIGCENCPDARTAPTPNKEAFEQADMRFEVAGSGTKNKLGDSFWKMELTGGTGWDLGEGSDKQRHTDSKHSLYVKHTLPNEVTNEKDRRLIVVAVGENEFGSFISAGYMEQSYTTGITLGRMEQSYTTGTAITLGRRYLGEGDLRAKWSVEELYERVSKTDRGVWRVVLEPCRLWTCSNVEWFRIAPWRTLDLHAEMCVLTEKSAKRKRGTKATVTATSSDRLPALNIPGIEEFSPEFTISDPIRSNVRWLEQCHGCGKEINDSATTCCKEVDEFDTEEPLRNVGFAFYCTAECARENGAPSWANAGKTWATDMSAPAGCRLKSNEAGGFWRAIESDKKAMKLMKDGGWTGMLGDPGDGEYHLMSAAVWSDQSGDED
jgi:hypothetical protein